MRRTTSAVQAKGRFRKASAEIVQQALAAIEKKNRFKPRSRVGHKP